MAKMKEELSAALGVVSERAEIVREECVGFLTKCFHEERNEIDLADVASCVLSKDWSELEKVLACLIIMNSINALASMQPSDIEEGYAISEEVYDDEDNDD